MSSERLGGLFNIENVIKLMSCKSFILNVLIYGAKAGTLLKTDVAVFTVVTS